MSRIEAVHVSPRRREGGSECSPTACQGPHHPKAELRPGREKKSKEKEPERRDKTSLRNWLTLTGVCVVLPPKNGLKITLKAINANCNDSGKGSEGFFGRSWSTYGLQALLVGQTSWHAKLDDFARPSNWEL